MTPIEIMALNIAGLVGIKLLVIMANPKKWMLVVNAIYGNPGITTVVGLVLAGWSLNHLLKTFTIVDIFAVMFFFMMLILVGAVGFAKELMPIANKMLKEKNILQRAWLATLIWVVLIAWVLWQLFA